MAWFLRFTRFGDAHFVYAQEKDNSCGIACVMMTVFKINKLVPGHAAIHTEREIYKAYSRVSHTKYDGTAYTYANHLASTLNHLHVGTWRAEFLGAGGVADAVVKSTGESGGGPVVSYGHGHYPIIALVGWSSGGAHFVVVDTVVRWDGKLYATVNDPWDGDVHVTPIQHGAPIHYVGTHVPWSWDLGGYRHDYSGTSTGDGNGWVVRRAH